MSDSSFNPGPAQRLCVDIKGPPVVKLAQDIISIQFSENRARCTLLEVSVNNWDGQIYQYSEGNSLHIGASISLYSGDIILAEGTISKLAPSFPKDSPSTLMFTVDAKHLPQNTRRRVRPAELVLDYGGLLIEFHPVVRKTANSSRHRVDAIGVAIGLPDLIAGALVKIEGLGTAFSGLYLVKETTHTIDDSGYTTRFACLRESRELRSMATR